MTAQGPRQRACRSRHRRQSALPPPALHPPRSCQQALRECPLRMKVRHQRDRWDPGRSRLGSRTLHGHSLWYASHISIPDPATPPVKIYCQHPWAAGLTTFWCRNMKDSSSPSFCRFGCCSSTAAGEAASDGAFAAAERSRDLECLRAAVPSRRPAQAQGIRRRHMARWHTV